MAKKTFHITMRVVLDVTDKKPTEASVQRALKHRLKDFAETVTMSVVELQNKPEKKGS